MFVWEGFLLNIHQLIQFLNSLFHSRSLTPYNVVRDIRKYNQLSVYLYIIVLYFIPVLYQLLSKQILPTFNSTLSNKSMYILIFSDNKLLDE